MRIALFVLFATISWGGMTSAAWSADFPLCKNHRATGGDILFLSRDGRALCWKTVKSNSISTKELANFSGAYRFVHVFGESNLFQEFDPIFNVQIKQIAREGETLSNHIRLYRKEIETLCGRSFFRKLDRHVQIEFRSSDMDGAAYNRFHEGKTLDPGRLLSRFHIWFRNSRNECVRTDSLDLRSAFTIEDILFPAREPLLARIFSGSRPAFASGPAASRYRQISVQIGRGMFRGDNIVATGSFSIPVNAEYDIVASDLSTYIDRQHRRPAKHFSIRHPGN